MNLRKFIHFLKLIRKDNPWGEGRPLSVRQAWALAKCLKE